MGQTAEVAAMEETRQETGLEVEIIKFLDYHDTFLPTGQFLTIYFQAKVIGGTLHENEPNKINDFQWTPIPEVKPLFNQCHYLLPKLLKIP